MNWMASIVYGVLNIGNIFKMRTDAIRVYLAICGRSIVEFTVEPILG